MTLARSTIKTTKFGASRCIGEVIVVLILWVVTHLNSNLEMWNRGLNEVTHLVNQMGSHLNRVEISHLIRINPAYSGILNLPLQFPICLQSSKIKEHVFPFSRPSNFHKNQIALSLVRSYPALAADSSEMPQVSCHQDWMLFRGLWCPFLYISCKQALWYHPHARGINRHAGRIHYRMEYLARQSDQRVRTPRRDIPDPQPVNVIELNNSPVNLDETVSILEYIIIKLIQNPFIFQIYF